MRNYLNLFSFGKNKHERRNWYYHALLEDYFKFIIPENSNVLEIGCSAGDLLNSVNPSNGVGVDVSCKTIEKAKKKYPKLNFYVQNAECLTINEKFDYIIISDLINVVNDVQLVLENIEKVANTNTRIVISNFNYLWEPILRFSEMVGLKTKKPLSNWLSIKDITNLLDLVEIKLIRVEKKILFPKYIPIISRFLNKYIANFPLINQLTLVNILACRKDEIFKKDTSVSIVIPARNEKGNIENAITRTPVFGTSQEFIFVEGNSTDGTFEEIHRIKEKYCEKKIKILKQTGIGKGNAVREAFNDASGEILMILDADLTMPPEDLTKYYKALVENKAEFINGCRLVYQMEGDAMRLLNIIANKFFSLLFTFLLGQHIKDTLCGTKVLYKSDYEKIKKNRNYFGDFDPFGDFDLLFGASKSNLKIVEIPIRYKSRQYGSTQIKRFSHGWLLIKMSVFAAYK